MPSIRKISPFVAAAFTLTAWAATASAQDAAPPPVSFKIISGTLGTSADVLMKKYWSNIGETTDGRLVARVQAREELGLEGAEVYRIARLGVAEVTSTALAYNAGEVPANDGVDLTGLVFDVPTLRKVADAWLPHIKAAYTDDIGLELVGAFPAVAQILWCSVPIEGLDDLQGKKIRASGVAMSELIAGLGAVATTIPFAEVVPSLQRHVIECAVTGTTSGNLNQWGDVATHVYPVVVGWAMQGIYANKKWWAGLHEQSRNEITKTMDAMIEEAWQRAETESNHGLWCSVADDRCDPSTTIKPLREEDLTLVPFTDADQQRVRQLAEERVLPDFAARCGKECAANWNASVGEILGVKAPVE